MRARSTVTLGHNSWSPPNEIMWGMVKATTGTAFCTINNNGEIYLRGGMTYVRTRLIDQEDEDEDEDEEDWS